MSQWYAITTIGRQEGKLAAGLAERGYPIFLPMETDWRGGVKHMEPLMPGYVFTLCDEEDFAEILGIEGCGSFVRYVRNDGISWPAAFPSAAILGLQIEERSGAFDKTRTIKSPKYMPKKGDRVKIKAGVYLGYFAKVLAAPRSDRAKLLIEGFDVSRHKTLEVSSLDAAA